MLFLIAKLNIRPTPAGNMREMKKPIGAVNIHSAVLLFSANMASNTVVTMFPTISEAINHGTLKNLDIIIPAVELLILFYS